jgi:pimeloyl-ACP methyl ester carboxylesterase
MIPVRRDLLVIAMLGTAALGTVAQNSMDMGARQMEYRSIGEGPGLVLVPGGLTGWVSWDAAVPVFAKDHQVLQVQLLSVEKGLLDEALPADYSVRMESEALAESIRVSGIATPVDLIGWSFGGLVLLDFALEHPQLVRTITLIEPPGFWLLDKSGKMDEETRGVIDMLDGLHGDISGDQLEMFMTSVGFAPTGTSLKDHPQWENWYKHRRSLRNSPMVPRHTDELERLRHTSMPVLLVKGTGSAPFLHQVIDVLADHLPDARVIELPGGHAPHLVSFDRFMEHVERLHKR